MTVKLAPGAVVLLENLRFHIEEEGKVKVKNADGTYRNVDIPQEAFIAVLKA